MPSVLASVAPLLLAVTTMMVGTSLLSILVPLRLGELNAGPGWIGLVMSAYFAGLLAGSVITKSLIERVGHIRAFAGLAAVMAASILVLYILPAIWAWLLLRALAGLCIAGLFTVLESWIGERATNQTRGTIFAAYMVVQYVAMILGQFAVNAWDVAGPEGFMLGAMLVSLSLVPVVLSRVPQPDLTGLQPFSLRQLIDASPLAVAGSAISGVMIGAYWGMGPVFGEAVGFSVFQISLFMGAMMLGGLCLQWPIGWLSDHFDRRTVLFGILVGMALVSLAGFALVQAGRADLATFAAISLFVGGFMASIYPISVAQAFDYLERTQYVAASGRLLFAYGAGAAIGPLAAAQLMDLTGNGSFFAFLGVSAILLGAFVVYRMFRRTALPSDQQESMIPVPSVAPIAYELDPYAIDENGGEEETDGVPTVPPP